MTFAPNETEQTFSVSITDDSEDESDETVALSLSNPSGATLGSTSAATLTIIDNDTLTAQFSATTYTVAENAGTATITVELTHSPVSTVTVEYATADGTAEAPDDYTSQSGTLTFAP